MWGLGMARFPLGVATMMQMRFDEAREIFAEAKREADRSSDPMVKSLVGYGAALVEFVQGDLDLADRLGEEAMRITESTGVSWISDIPGRTLRAEILRERGRLDEAIEVLRAPAIGPTGLYEEARAVAALADVLCDLGRPAEAIEVARGGIAEAGEDVLGAAWCHRSLARALKLTGDPAGAERALRDELDLLAESDWDEERVQILALLAAVLDDQKRYDESATTLDQARAIVRRFPPGSNISGLEELLTT